MTIHQFPRPPYEPPANDTDWLDDAAVPESEAVKRFMLIITTIASALALAAGIAWGVTH